MAQTASKQIFYDHKRLCELKAADNTESISQLATMTTTTQTAI